MVHYQKKVSGVVPIDEMLESVTRYEWKFPDLKDSHCDRKATNIVDSLTELIEEGHGRLSVTYINTLLFAREYRHPIFLRFITKCLYIPYEYKFNGAPTKGVTVKQRKAVREVYSLYLRLYRSNQSGSYGKAKEYVCKRFGIEVSNLEKLMKKPKNKTRS